CVQAIAFPYSF
nr:immunoglobulin light chain junction region [Macaca mulatta]MOV78485.1 immunoglobulin light chain junction region [Macaca mulatta]MOV79369.1 immunoglobulin light chain junction region [Macaca mulatta]MOV79535.1 immunoglobulin light chain junction region [Macaca mulatta]MOV81695.1 immunoglobulin light chain junction region [Macaca mulatta]